MTQKEELEIVELIKTTTCRADICRKLNWGLGGSFYKKINKLISKYEIDISHFKINKAHLLIKYKRCEKTCPVCNKVFMAQIGHKKEKITCSKGCSNTLFRSGSNNGNYTPLEEKSKSALKSYTGYRKLFTKEELKCSRCGYNEFSCSVEIHHIDENRLNNDKSNLLPLCANCHSALHSNKFVL